MADSKVGRIEFGHATRDHRGDAIAYDPAAMYELTATFNPTGTLSPRFVPEFEPSGDEPMTSVCAGCAPGDDNAKHKRSFFTPVTLTDIINLAIRVGRGTATIKELSDRLAPYGVRRKV